MEKFVFDENLKNKLYIFKDRKDAGEKLAEFIKDYLKNKDVLILAIPSGGVPVAKEISQKLNLPMDLLIVRKIQLPWTTEAGFGAMNLDKDVVLNRKLINYYKLTKEQIEKQKEKTWKTLLERNKIFRKNKPFPDLTGKTVVIVDDGLASGYTLKAGIEFVKKRNPEEIIVAVPTCSYDSTLSVLPIVDKLICLNVRDIYPYAVADAYQEWHDLTKEEVLDLLRDGNQK